MSHVTQTFRVLFVLFFNFFFSQIIFYTLEPNERSVWELNIDRRLIQVSRPFTTPSVPSHIQSSCGRGSKGL